jgi:hypothetical protein
MVGARTHYLHERRRSFSLALALVLTMLAAVVGPGPIGAAAQTTISQTSPALPQGDDLTLADGAGNVLIGLTVRPAQPGQNTILIHVLPLEGLAVAADVQISLSIDGQAVPLEFCSRSCRTADLSLAGGEHIDVAASSSTSGTASFDIPALPSPDGDSQIQHVQDRMHRLHTFRSDEILRPAPTPLETLYAFQAPDRMQLDIGNGSHSIFVGTTRYSRDDASGPVWQAQDIGVALQVPSFVWDPRPSDGPFIGVHVIGAENVDGFDTKVLAFFENLGQYPFWFRLWADADGLVHRAEMRGQGHFMDEHYTDFDAPFSIQPPT